MSSTASESVVQEEVPPDMSDNDNHPEGSDPEDECMFEDDPDVELPPDMSDHHVDLALLGDDDKTESDSTSESLPPAFGDAIWAFWIISCCCSSCRCCNSESKFRI